MTPEQFVSALQAKMGDGYFVAAHPKKRAEPQFDVMFDPIQIDADGSPYSVTFSARASMIEEIEADHSIIGEYAETVAQNLALQKVRRKSAPEWRQ